MGKKTHRRGGPKGWIGYLFFFFLGALLGLGAYLYWIREKPASSEDFSQKIFLVEKIIQSQLYELDIPKKSILLHQTSLKKEGSLVWKESSLKVQILPSVAFSLVEGKLRGSLSGLGKSVSIRFSQKSESLLLEVKVWDRVTHRITFVSSLPSSLRMRARPRIAIVIDDLGGENKISQELLRWDLPITFSILPFAPFSKRLAKEAHQKGREVILHLPMEPHGYPQVRPGDGVLLEEMDETNFVRQLSEDIEAVPYIKGVSNHMGSRLMEDPDKMKIIFSELKRRGLFFLDSRTTPQTTGFQVAHSVGVKILERSIFIDHSLVEEDIKRQLEELIRCSISKGKAIGIGHPHPSTIKYLREMVPKIKEKGIDLVPLSSVME